MAAPLLFIPTANAEFCGSSDAIEEKVGQVATPSSKLKEIITIHSHTSLLFIRIRDRRFRRAIAIVSELYPISGQISRLSLRILHCSLSQA